MEMKNCTLLRRGITSLCTYGWSHRFQLFRSLPALLLLWGFVVHAPAQVTFVLVDAATDQDIRTLHDGDRLDLSTLPAALNIRADIAPGLASQVESVDFRLKNRKRVENIPPYAVAGDSNGDYYDMDLQTGNYNLRATLYPYDNAGGKALFSTFILFKVVRDAANRPPVLSVELEDLYCKAVPIGIQVRGTDPEGGALTYAFDPAGGTPPPFLSLDRHTGLISGLINTPGSSTWYEFAVRATDPQGLSATLPIELFAIVCSESVGPIASFTVVNAATDQDIFTVAFDVGKGTWPPIELDLATLPAHLNIRANIQPFYRPYLKSVVWELRTNGYGTGTEVGYQRTENVAPYALGGDSGGDYASFPFQPGNYLLSADGYTGDGGKGDLLIRQFGSPQLIVSNSAVAPLLAAGTLPPGQVKVYPNPFQEQLQVLLHSEGNTTIRLILLDGQGRTVLDRRDALGAGLNHFQLALPGDLPKGIYFLRFTGEDGREWPGAQVVRQ